MRTTKVAESGTEVTHREHEILDLLRREGDLLRTQLNHFHEMDVSTRTQLVLKNRPDYK